MATVGQTLVNPVSGERIETAVALADQGRTMRGGIPKPLELALFTREFGDEVQAAFPPRWLQRLALAPLAWLAARRGRSLEQARRNSGRTWPVTCQAAGRTGWS